MKFDTQGLKVFGGRKIKVKTIFLQRTRRNGATWTEGLGVRIGWKHLSVFILASLRLFMLVMLFFWGAFFTSGRRPRRRWQRRQKNQTWQNESYKWRPPTYQLPLWWFLHSHLAFLFFFPSFFCSSREPAPRLNCHRTVRTWQVALIHIAVAPSCREKKKGVGEVSSLGLKPMGHVTRKPPTWLSVREPDYQDAHGDSPGSSSTVILSLLWKSKATKREREKKNNNIPFKIKF